jgi:hypothetical protein
VLIVMRKSGLVVALVMAGVVLAPATVLAGRDHSGRGGEHGHAGGGPGFKGGHGFRGHGQDHHGFRSGHFGKGHDGFRGGHHGFKGRDGFKHRQSFGFFPVVTLYVPPLYYGYGYGLPVYAPPVYAPPPVYYPPAYAAPTVYTAPGVYAASAATLSPSPAQPIPRVLEYPNGRFVLQGDGVTVPHAWVWIPNAPPPPPEPVPAPPAPAGDTTRVQPTSRDGAPSRLSPLYRWTDEQGVIHLTNRPDAVPRDHDAQPKRAPTL